MHNDSKLAMTAPSLRYRVNSVSTCAFESDTWTIRRRVQELWSYPASSKVLWVPFIHGADKRMLRACGAEPASPDEARELIGLTC